MVLSLTPDCPQCGGTGKLTCPACGGKGCPKCGEGCFMGYWLPGRGWNPCTCAEIIH